MKITIQNEDKEISLTVDDETTIDELGDELKGLLVAFGYHSNNVDDLFNLERWSEEKDEE